MIALAITLILGSAAHADERSITVMGTGRVLAKPNLLEIELHAAGEAELMADATTKYEGAVRRITGAIDKLGIDGLKIEPRGIRMTNQSPGDEEGVIAFAPVGGGRQAAPKTQSGISRSLRVIVPKIDHMSESEVIATIAKLLDAAKDAGAAVGPRRTSNHYEYIVTSDSEQFQPGVVAFAVADSTAAREEAYRKAFEDATRRAARVATLAKAKLGDVLSADESHYEQMVVYGGRGASGGDDRLVSSTLEDIPVRVSLQVRFALRPDDQHVGAKQATEK